MTWPSLVSAFVTLFVTVDPLGLAPIFMSITAGMSPVESRAVAWRASLLAFLILGFFLFAGETLLRGLGIEFAALRISGGLLLFWIAFEMIFERRAGRKQRTAETQTLADRHAVAAFPLAIPLMAGPGAITAIILLSAKAPDYADKALIAATAAGVVLCCLGLFLAAGWLARFVGDNIQILVSRLMGLILAALAVQFVIDGVKDVFVAR